MPDSIIRLEFYSSLDMLGPVQAVADQVGRMVGFDEDALHWINVSVRESVINAIKHGNRNDRRKRVFVEFLAGTDNGSGELTVRVRDEGPGFDPSKLADPLSPENVLNPDGRGVFLIRSLMDEVVLQRAPEGGMEMRMVKRVRREGST
jgi:serine/threonine-protein kinase RsbW